MVYDIVYKKEPCKNMRVEYDGANVKVISDVYRDDNFNIEFECSILKDKGFRYNRDTSTYFNTLIINGKRLNLFSFIKLVAIDVDNIDNAEWIYIVATKNFNRQDCRVYYYDDVQNDADGMTFDLVRKKVEHSKLQETNLFVNHLVDMVHLDIIDVYFRSLERDGYKLFANYTIPEVGFEVLVPCHLKEVQVVPASV